MDPVTLGVIGGSALAQGVGTIFTNSANSAQAKKNRDFQERMSNTAHQREMADLKRSGLNPLLTGKYGGASTPTGNVATMQNPVEGLPQAASSAASLMQSKPLVAAQIANTQADTVSKTASAVKTAAETKAIEQTIGQADVMNPQQLKKITSEIELNRGASALQASTINKTNLEIEKLNLELKKLDVQRRLWDVAGQLTPAAKTIVDQVIKMKNAVMNNPDSRGQTIQILK